MMHMSRVGRRMERNHPYAAAVAACTWPTEPLATNPPGKGHGRMARNALRPHETVGLSHLEGRGSRRVTQEGW